MGVISLIVTCSKCGLKQECNTHGHEVQILNWLIQNGWKITGVTHRSREWTCPSCLKSNPVTN